MTVARNIVNIADRIAVVAVAVVFMVVCGHIIIVIVIVIVVRLMPELVVE
jgi:hypothetical protein